MKKLLIFFIALIFSCSQNIFCASVNPDDNGDFQSYINKIGFKILNANEIPISITFKYDYKNSMEAHLNKKKNIIYIPKELLTYADSEDEVGALISFQIAYCLRYNDNLAPILAPKNFQKYTDKTAVDLMKKAGYSPIAAINILNKTIPDEKQYIFSKSEKKSVRLMNIYEYIARRYPEQLINNKLQNNIYYQNFLLNSNCNRELLETRLMHNPNLNKKIKYR